MYEVGSSLWSSQRFLILIGKVRRTCAARTKNKWSQLSYHPNAMHMHMRSHRCPLRRLLAVYFGGVPFPIRGREIKTRFITNNYLSTSLIFSAINSTKQASTWRRDKNIIVRCLSSSINDDKEIVYFHISPR